MYSRRIRMVALSAMLLSALTATPAAAAKPIGAPPTPTAPPTITEPPLTAEQLAASDRKVAAAEAYLAGTASKRSDLATLSCVTPTGTVAEAPAAATADRTIQACWVPQGFLAVEARDQVFGHYCGPAVGQVIANYSWAVGPGRNVFTQQQLAAWMG
ncbi:MAG: hypothetical protein ACRDFY_08380, partial [Candidatus Limnocylindria bacterium]